MSTPDPDDLVQRAMRHADQRQAQDTWFDTKRGLQRLERAVAPHKAPESDPPADAGSGAETQAGRFTVSCPACKGSGRIVPHGLSAPESCTLCFERGRVPRIVAERYRSLGVKSAGRPFGPPVQESTDSHLQEHREKRA